RAVVGSACFLLGLDLFCQALVVAQQPTSPAILFPDSRDRLTRTTIQQTSDLASSQSNELSVDLLVQAVLARNPSLAQMNAAWQAASARYPQVTSLDDPMFGATVAPVSFGSNAVESGYRVEISQKLPYFGKRELRGQNALAEASAAGHDVDDMRLQ